MQAIPSHQSRIFWVIGSSNAVAICMEWLSLGVQYQSSLLLESRAQGPRMPPRLSVSQDGLV